MQKLALVVRIDRFGELCSTIGPDRALAVHDRLFEIVCLACRSTDRVLHCSADECGAILWVVDPDDGGLLADRIRDRVRDATFCPAEGLELRLTCSVGFCAHPPSDDRASAVVHWHQTVELARLAAEAATGMVGDSWVGHLGTDRLPPSAPDSAVPPGGRRAGAGWTRRVRPLRCILADRRRGSVLPDS